MRSDVLADILRLNIIKVDGGFIHQLHIAMRTGARLVINRVVTIVAAGCADILRLVSGGEDEDGAGREANDQ